jgi:hypothetical protein
MTHPIHYVTPVCFHWRGGRRQCPAYRWRLHLQRPGSPAPEHPLSGRCRAEMECVPPRRVVERLRETHRFTLPLRLGGALRTRRVGKIALRRAITIPNAGQFADPTRSVARQKNCRGVNYCDHPLIKHRIVAPARPPALSEFTNGRHGARAHESWGAHTCHGLLQSFVIRLIWRPGIAAG